MFHRMHISLFYKVFHILHLQREINYVSYFYKVHIITVRKISEKKKMIQLSLCIANVSAVFSLYVSLQKDDKIVQSTKV